VPGSDTGGIRINSLGFRSPELEPKSPSMIRLTFIGASTTYSAEVRTNDKTWPHLVWQSLQQRYPDRHLDYVNAAVPGLSVSGSLKNLTNRVRPIRPDVVVLYEGFNDLIVDARQLALRQGLTVPADSDWLGRWSLAWDLIRKNYQILRAQHRARDSQMLRVDWADLAASFKLRLAGLIAASQQTGRVVAVATMSYRLRHEQSPDEQVRAAEAALFYMPFLTPEGMLSGYEHYNDAIRQAARDAGIILIDDELSIPGSATYFADTIHFTEAGSEMMARRVKSRLQDEPAFLALMRAPYETTGASPSNGR
jgi:lysophospholipase L1-like esterase